MTPSLETLLLRLRGGDVRPGDLEVARSLAASDARIPESLRGGLFVAAEDLESDAAGVLALLGRDDLGEVLAAGLLADPPALDAVDDGWSGIAAALVDGLRAESRGVEVAEAVVRRLPVAAFAHGGLVGPAVADEVGALEVAADVARALGIEALPVAEATRAEAGRVDVASAVMDSLSLPAIDVAGAVRSEAGTTDVVADVMARVGAWRADEGGSSAPAAAANGSRWSFAGFALAAALLVSVLVSRFEQPIEVPAAAPLVGAVFAHAGEVVIEDLEYGERVQVVQTEGEDGAVILWVDEEA